MSPIQPAHDQDSGQSSKAKAIESISLPPSYFSSRVIGRGLLNRGWAAIDDPPPPPYFLLIELSLLYTPPPGINYAGLRFPLVQQLFSLLVSAECVGWAYKLFGPIPVTLFSSQFKKYHLRIKIRSLSLFSVSRGSVNRSRACYRHPLSLVILMSARVCNDVNCRLPKCCYYSHHA